MELGIGTAPAVSPHAVIPRLAGRQDPVQHQPAGNRQLGCGFLANLFLAHPRSGDRLLTRYSLTLFRTKNVQSMSSNLVRDVKEKHSGAEYGNNKR